MSCEGVSCEGVSCEGVRCEGVKCEKMEKECEGIGGDVTTVRCEV